MAAGCTTCCCDIWFLDVATVLICDDEDFIRGLIRASLSGGGYTFVEARDGDEAVSLAIEHRPDLILLDMMMPRRSGLDVLRVLKSSDDAVARTPIIMLTAQAGPDERAQAAAAGATRFLAKPFRPAQLAATVSEVLTQPP